MDGQLVLDEIVLSLKKQVCSKEQGFPDLALDLDMSPFQILPQWSLLFMGQASIVAADCTALNDSTASVFCCLSRFCFRISWQTQQGGTNMGANLQ